MKSLLPLLLLLILSLGTKAQLISNKLNIYISTNHYLSSGATLLVEKEGLQTPSLFRNMETVPSFSVKGIYSYRSFISLGAGIDVVNYWNWEASDYDHYTDARIRELVISPMIQFHLKRKEMGFLNHVKPSAQLGPLIGTARVEFPQPLFLVVSSSNPDLSPLLSSTDALFGFKGSLGMEVIINRFIGLTANYGVKQFWLFSPLYQEDQVSQSFLEGGLFFRLFKNKRFYH